MIQDEYLIEVLVRSGYKLEDIKSDKFKVTRILKEDIVLARVTNLDELSIFADTAPTFLISEDDIRKQTYNELGNILKRYSLRASIPNLKLENIKSNASAIILNGFDLENATYDFNDARDISFMHCLNLNISTISKARINLFDMDEFDLSCVGEGISNLNCLNIGRVYLSKNTTNSYYGWFNNCTFDNNGNVLTLISGMDIINSNFLTDCLMFKPNFVSWRRLDFLDLAKSLKTVAAKYSVDIYNMNVLDESIEGLLTADSLPKIRLIDPKGYDPRRLNPVLDLSKNSDLLESYEALEKILKNNKYIKTIMITENLTAEQKEWLRLLASDKEYTYIPFDREQYKSANNSDIFPSFEDFIKADEIFEEIVSGIDPNWGELEKFKYIYTKLGELVSYDINIVYKEDKENCYRANLITRDIFKSILTGKGVCAGFAQIYQYVCRKAGLMCYTEKQDNHEYNIIQYKDEEGKIVKSYCDLTWDSERIKRRQKCLYFGKSKETFKFHKDLKDSDTVDISEERIEDIDKTISYERETLYKEIINKALKIESGFDRAQYMIEEMVKIKSLCLMSNDEVVKFAKYLLLNVKIKEENVGIAKGFAGKDKSELNDPRVILWLKDTSNDEEKIHYWTFNKNKQKFMDLDKETLEDLILSGMLELYGEEELPQIPTYKRKSNIEH